MAAGTNLWNTPGLEAAFRRLYSTGMSHSKISAALYEEFRIPFTRSALIGKANRLKLEPRHTGKTELTVRPRRRRPRQPKPEKQKIFILPKSRASRAERMKAQRERILAFADTLPTFDTFYEDGYSTPESRVALLDLRNGQCRWPYGDSEITFCGKDAPHSSYCTYHALVSTYGARGAASLICEAAE